ncbi:MAG: hypothetical protein HON61_00585 [Alphaproteobacteria bacterium]|nr:hypothetical protein [Alphaproteobacteria bacterium]
MEKSLDIKLEKTRQGKYKPSDFIIADAKDGDMGGGITAFGHVPEDPSRSKSYTGHLEDMREMTTSKLIDVMLMSVSGAERLVNDEVFKNSSVTPAVRLNDTSDIWGPRGSKYKIHPAQNFRSARIDKVIPLVDLGLYSITFSNDLKSDLASLNEFHSFLDNISGKNLRYFLEVFNPQIDIGIDKENLPGYVNDSIVRSLAGLTKEDSPLFLKIPFNGPKAMEELCQYDPGNLIVGVLGGGIGTTRDTFELIRQSEKYGARIALFGRKILFAEVPKLIVTMMRAVVQGEMSTEEAVKMYHSQITEMGISPKLSLEDDLKITDPVLLNDI